MDGVALVGSHTFAILIPGREEPDTMLALIALLCFVLALFDVRLGDIDPVILGFVFIAAHLLFDWRPWIKTRG